MFKKAIILTICVQATVTYADTYGLGYERSKDESRVDDYVDSGPLRVEIDGFHLHEGNTDMYGIAPGVGYSLFDSKHFRLYAVGHINAGVTVSPSTQYTPCTANSAPTYANTAKVDPAVDQDVTSVDNAVNAADKQSTSIQNQSCQSSAQTASSMSGYGAAMYYDLGLAPDILLFDHVSLNVFAGYRWPHGSRFLNTGDLDVHGPVVRAGLSLEF